MTDTPKTPNVIAFPSRVPTEHHDDAAPEYELAKLAEEYRHTSVQTILAHYQAHNGGVALVRLEIAFAPDRALKGPDGALFTRTFELFAELIYGMYDGPLAPEEHAFGNLCWEVAKNTLDHTNSIRTNIVRPGHL
jgi:hypothetical protein